MTIDHIESFFIDLYTSDEQRPSISTLNGYRSALRFMFTEQNIALQASFEQNLKILFRGLKRTIVQDQQDGHRRIRTGKDEMSSGLYCFLA